VTAATLAPRFDALDPQIREDPYPRYAELRAHGPLARGGPGTWLVTRHAEVSALLGDRRLGNELPARYHELSLGDGPAAEFFGRILFHRDPPDHTRLRRLMAAQFTPRLVGSYHDEIAGIVDEVLEPAIATGRLDAITGLAHPLSLRAICLLLAIPPADQAAVLPRAADLARGFAFGCTDEERRATDAATVWLRRYLDDLLHERARRPDDDLLSRMLAAATGPDALTRQEIVDNCVFLFWAGFETVMSVVGTAFAALARFGDQFAALRDRPALVPRAVEELLRFDAPIQGTSRIVREELVIGGQRLRPGRVLVLLIGSANHDERVFAEPARLDVARDPNPHVSFGGGWHRCLGNVLARAETATVLERLVRRVRTLEPAGEPTRRTGMAWMRFHATVPVALTGV
jgi:cytochrome P450